MTNLPYWRYVEYTDDGCSIYQCLSCMNKWESRDAPGYYTETVETDDPSESAWSYHGVNGIKYFKGCDPVYHSTWKYCPHCGIPWKSAIRCQIDNERMFGPKRQVIENAIREHELKHGWADLHPDWWWIIQERTYWHDRNDAGQERWSNYARMNPNVMGAVKAQERLKYERAQLNLKEPLFNTTDEMRLIKLTADEVNSPTGYSSLREITR